MYDMQEIEIACEKNQSQKVPQHTLDALNRYRYDGLFPGDFLYAVLTNDFMQAFSKADDLNIANMYAIAKWVYNEMPTAAFGSPENIKSWIKLKSGDR
jgi:hypothetical protein